MTGIDGNSASSAFVAAQYGLQSASEGISQASSSIAQRTAEDAVAPAQPIQPNTAALITRTSPGVISGGSGLAHLRAALKNRTAGWTRVAVGSAHARNEVRFQSFLI